MIFKSLHMPFIRTLKNTRKHSNKTHRKFLRQNKWSKFYQSREWNNLRQSQLIRQPLCERCLSNDKVTPATTVHHKNVFGSCPDEQQQWYWFLNSDNLMSLCNQCHNHIHATNERGYVYHWPFDTET